MTRVPIEKVAGGLDLMGMTRQGAAKAAPSLAP